MSPRRDITMAPNEIDAFLRTRSRVVVAGMPAVGAVQGAFGRLLYANGHVGFALWADDPMVTLLEADNRACCVVEQFPSYYEIMGVMLHGRARRSPDGPVEQAHFDLEVDKVVSFDFGKLPGALQPGQREPEAEH